MLKDEGEGKPILGNYQIFVFDFNGGIDITAQTTAMIVLSIFDDSFLGFNLRRDACDIMSGFFLFHSRRFTHPRQQPFGLIEIFF